MVIVKVEDLLKKVDELNTGGYEYVEVSEVEKCKLFGDDIPGFISFGGLSGKGATVDYGDLEHIDMSLTYKTDKVEKTFSESLQGGFIMMSKGFEDRLKNN